MITHQIIFNYLKGIKNYDITEVVSFVYLYRNKNIRVRYKSLRDNTLRWDDISVENLNNYLPTYRELLINQILK